MGSLLLLIPKDATKEDSQEKTLRNNDTKYSIHWTKTSTSDNPVVCDQKWNCGEKRGLKSTLKADHNYNIRSDFLFFGNVYE